MEHFKKSTTTEVYGFSAITNNLNEQTSDKAKIGKLWTIFYQKLAPKMEKNSSIYGVYFNYESDHNSNYSILVGVDASSEESQKISEDKCDLMVGDYLKFSKKGPMPESVILLWQEIWRFFDDNDCLYTRAYLTDYEQYTDDGVDIFIGIKK